MWLFLPRMAEKATSAIRGFSWLSMAFYDDE